MVYDNEINEPVELLSINPKRDKPLEIDDGYDENSSTYWNLEDVKPYLRPMSSMTKADEKFYNQFFDWYEQPLKDIVILIEWLNANHFDYRGLIPMGLALEAPEGLYGENC